MTRKATAKTLPLAADRQAAIRTVLLKGAKTTGELQELFADWYVGTPTANARLYADLRELGAVRHGQGRLKAWHVEGTPAAAPEPEPETETRTEEDASDPQDVDDDEDDDEDVTDEEDTGEEEEPIGDFVGTLPPCHELPNEYLAKCVTEARRRLRNVDALYEALGTEG